MGYDDEPAPPLTEHQQQVLASVQKQELLDAFNQVLADMGLALTVRSVDFQELASVPVSDPIGPDPSTGPPTEGLPVVPGIHYICEQLDSGAWVCKCTSAPETIASFPP